MRDARRQRRLVLVVHCGDIERDLFSVNARDACHEPNLRWRESVRALGLEVVQASRQAMGNVAGVVYWGARAVRSAQGLRGLKATLAGRDEGVRRDWITRARLAGLGGHVILIMWEPPVVEPDDWSPRLMARFRKVLTYDDDLVDGDRYVKFHFPVPNGRSVAEGPPFADRKQLTAVFGNKTSTHEDGLYSVRGASIRHFADATPDQFDLWGRGWSPDDPEVTTGSGIDVGDGLSGYRGPCESKSKVLRRYRFSLCYENAAAPRGYITEKIFDSLRAGCVPVYLGAPNVTDYVDAGAFIDRRAFESDAALEAYLAQVTEREWKAMRAAAATYLASDRFTPFLPDSFARTLNASLGLTSDGRSREL